MKTTVSFFRRERDRQVAFFDAHHPDRPLHKGIPYRFADRAINFMPGLDSLAQAYFAGHAERAPITWHTHANHALSSQVCCLNFLMPLANDRDRTTRFLAAALGIEGAVVQPVETDPDGREWFIGFEWTGAGDYLNEQVNGRPVQRGSNSTSADAFLKFDHAGKRHGLLIEWKYTESYGPPLPDRRRPDGTGGNVTRSRRYAEIAFEPNGPIRGDLGLHLEDFFWEPFYQLLRQQMLAYQMEKHGEADVVLVLHLSPRGNIALHRVTAPTLRPRGTDAFDVFRTLLVRPDRFVDRRIEDVFSPLLATCAADDPWRRYLQARYQFLMD